MAESLANSIDSRRGNTSAKLGIVLQSSTSTLCYNLSQWRIS